jgi:hypothetical protein
MKHEEAMQIMVANQQALFAGDCIRKDDVEIATSEGIDRNVEELVAAGSRQCREHDASPGSKVEQLCNMRPWQRHPVAEGLKAARQSYLYL